MTVKVTLHAELRRYLPPGTTGPLEIELQDDASVNAVLRQMNVPDDEILTIGLNGELAKRDTILSSGDEIVLFTPMEGG